MPALTRSTSVRRRTTALTVLLLLVVLALTVAPASSAAGADAAGHGGTASSATAVHGTTGGHATGVQQRLRGGARAAARGPGYAFASVLDRRPVRWNPCQPIRWTFNPSGAPAGALPVLRSAVARVAAASGTHWVYVGPTTTRPTSAVLPKSARASYPPVVLGWTDGSSDLLQGQAKGVLAMTRTAWFGVQRADGSKVAAVRAAVVAFDRTDRLPLHGPVSWHAVALHELGHVMGLAHVSDTRQLMATVLPRTAAELQRGDKIGLMHVGRPAGCVTVPS